MTPGAFRDSSLPFSYPIQIAYIDFTMIFRLTRKLSGASEASIRWSEWLGDSQGLDSLDLDTDLLGRIPQVYRTLRVQPELGRVAK